MPGCEAKLSKSVIIIRRVVFFHVFFFLNSETLFVWSNISIVFVNRSHLKVDIKETTFKSLRVLGRKQTEYKETENKYNLKTFTFDPYSVTLYAPLN